jgi:hypothetical protein
MLIIWASQMWQTAPLPVWSPADLFASGEQGIWGDVQDISTLFQDTAGTVPVTATGQRVARINDKSGRGNNGVQATVAAQPIYRFDSSIGKYYLEFDGVDDRLVFPVTLSAIFDRLTVARQETWTANDQLWSQGSTGSPELRQFTASPGLRIIGPVTTMPTNNGLIVGTTGLITELLNGTASNVSLQINNNTPTTSTSTGFAAPTSLALGARTGGTLAGNFRVYEFVVTNNLLAANLLEWKNYAASRYGITL